MRPTRNLLTTLVCTFSFCAFQASQADSSGSSSSSFSVGPVSGTATSDYQVSATAGTYYDGDITSTNDVLYTGNAGNTYSGTSATSDHSNGAPYANNTLALFDGASSGASDIGDSNAYYPGYELPSTITVTLGGNTLGYNISSLIAVGGWNNEQQGSTAFTLAYESYGQTSFTTLGTFTNLVPYSADQYNNGDVHGLADGTETTLDFSGLNNVTALKFTFVSPGTSASVYHDIDAFGTAATTIPEPSIWAMLLGGVLALGGVLRLRSRRA